ncbi:MAG TPA: hypothetical protein VF228_07650, partial [Iamia sp.]
MSTATAERPSSVAPGGWTPLRLPRLSFRAALVAIVIAAALVRLGGAWAGSPCLVTDRSEKAAAAAAEGRCVSYNDSITYLRDARQNA